MHDRIRQRRESVVAQASFGNDATDSTSIVQVMEALEAKATAISAVCFDVRIPTLMATIKSTKIIIEMSLRNAEAAKLLAPCASAALLHVRTEMLRISRDLIDRTEPECGPRQPHAEFSTTWRPG